MPAAAIMTDLRRVPAVPRSVSNPADRVPEPGWVQLQSREARYSSRYAPRTLWPGYGRVPIVLRASGRRSASAVPRERRPSPSAVFGGDLVAASPTSTLVLLT